MKVVLISSTPRALEVIATAGRVCYSSKDIESIQNNFTEEEIVNMLQKLISSGHHSTLEHVSFTFGIEGVSRALSHQLVRHRIASYSQKSQRYVKEKQFEFVIPPSIIKAGLEEDYINRMQTIQEVYNGYIKAGVPAEDARYILPNACETQLLVTMNVRSLINFFKHRLCKERNGK